MIRMMLAGLAWMLWTDNLTASNVWSPLTNLDLPGSVLDWTDQASTNNLERFYRALLVR